MTKARGPVVNGEQFPVGYTAEAAAYEQATRLPTPVKHSSRTAFGIVWFESEADADRYGEAVRANGQTYNGGFMDGVACGRDRNWDMDEDGRRLYAVTTR